MSDTSDEMQGANLFQQSMQEALAHLDKLKEDLRVEQEKAIDMQLAAQEELNRIKRDAERLATDAYLEKMNEHIRDLRLDLYKDVLQKLILGRVPSDKLQLILEPPPDLLPQVWFDIGFAKLNDMHIGHVGYKSQGRGGTVIFYRNDLTTSFYYEFGGGDAVAIITIPTVEHWTAQTGIPVEERDETLKFIAERVLHDQVPGGKYFIGPSDIVFMRQ